MSDVLYSEIVRLVLEKTRVGDFEWHLNEVGDICGESESLGLWSYVAPASVVVGFHSPDRTGVEAFSSDGPKCSKAIRELTAHVRGIIGYDTDAHDILAILRGND